jgi:hypothetical protein
MIIIPFSPLLQITIFVSLGVLVSASSNDLTPTWQPRNIDPLPKEEQMIADFLRDVASIENIQTNSTILTPCYKISRDSSFTRSWTHEDWLQRK